MKVLTESTAWRLVDRGAQSGLFFMTIDNNKLLARIGGRQPTIYLYDRHWNRYIGIDIDTLRALWELHR